MELSMSEQVLISFPVELPMVLQTPEAFHAGSVSCHFSPLPGEMPGELSLGSAGTVAN